MKITDKYEIYNGDCLEVMKDIKDKTVDMILCDLPYGCTAKNKWDSIIPYEPLWENYNRIIKNNGIIILFGQNKFTATTIMSNLKYYRYSLVWDKGLVSGFLNANRMPLRQHEDIMIFYKKLPVYNPQKVKGNPCHSRGKRVGDNVDGVYKNNNYNNSKILNTEGDMKHPTSILKFDKVHPSKSYHPTEKSIKLLEWLIKSYTNEGMIVLDNCMGSGSTGIACLNTNRYFIGIEKEKEYFDISEKRLHCNLK